MSYNEQATKINKRLGELLDPINMNMLNHEQWKSEIVNNILWFGQVAKFRCRSNAAYDNFARLCFEGIVELERKTLEGNDFEVLQVKQ